MACCGQKRTAWKRQQEHHTTDQHQQIGLHTSANAEKELLSFEYIGTSSLLVRGAITNTSYSFRLKGDILDIDMRDVPSIMAEPNLKRVSSSFPSRKSTRF